MKQEQQNNQGKLLIYGATGHTGSLVAREAARRGINFEIAGRTRNKVIALAKELAVPYHVFDVTDVNSWKAALHDKTALLNIAGPFSETAEWAMEACIQFHVHYFDITAEVDIYQLAESKDEAAKAARIMLLSGAGLFATYDPLALHTAQRVSNPVAMRAAFQYSGGFTPGSIASSANIINAGNLVRQDNQIKKLHEAANAEFDFGDGLVACFPTPLGGIVLCYRSTGIPNIEEYFQMALPAETGEQATVGIPGTSAADFVTEKRSKIIVEVTGAGAEVKRSMVDMPAGYMPTVTSAVEIVSRALKGEFKIGFQSPASAYGVELLHSLTDINITDF